MKRWVLCALAGAATKASSVSFGSRSAAAARFDRVRRASARDAKNWDRERRHREAHRAHLDRRLWRALTEHALERTEDRPFGIGSHLFGVESEFELTPTLCHHRGKPFDGVSRRVGEAHDRVVTAVAEGDHRVRRPEIDAESQKAPSLAPILPQQATLLQKAQNFLEAHRSILEMHSKRRGPIVRVLNRGVLVVLSALALSCRKGAGEGRSGEGPIQVIDVEAPLGAADGPPVSKCDRDGDKCSAVAKSDGISAGSLVKTARGARASVALGSSANLDLGEESAVYLASPGSIEVNARVDRRSKARELGRGCRCDADRARGPHRRNRLQGRRHGDGAGEGQPIGPRSRSKKESSPCDRPSGRRWSSCPAKPPISPKGRPPERTRGVRRRRTAPDGERAASGDRRSPDLAGSGA